MDDTATSPPVTPRTKRVRDKAQGFRSTIDLRLSFGPDEWRLGFNITRVLEL